MGGSALQTELIKGMATSKRVPGGASTVRCGPTRGLGGKCQQDMGTSGVLGPSELQPTQEAKAPPGGAW